MSFARQFVLSKDKVYLTLPGTSGNYASTPDSAAVSITGDIDIRAKIAPDAWIPPASTNTIAAKWTETGNQRGYVLQLTGVNGNLILVWSTDGIDTPNVQSTVATGFVDGSIHWVRATLDVDNGAAGHDVKFYTSEDGIAWTQLGATITTAGVTSIFDSTAILEVGTHSVGTAQRFDGKIYYAEVRNGIDGPVVAKFDPANDATLGGTSFTSSTGEIWTINQSGAPAAGLAGSGRVTMNTGTIASESFINGQAYMSSGLAIFVSTAAVGATDSFIGGFRYTSTGALRVSDVTSSGVPASNSINQGILMTDDGQVCFSQNAAATVYTLGGISMTVDGVVYADTF